MKFTIRAFINNLNATLNVVIKILRDQRLSLSSTRIYQALALSVLLNAAETWLYGRENSGSIPLSVSA